MSSKLTREEKLFRKEIKVLNDYRDFTAQDYPYDETKTALNNLTVKYKSLLEQTRFLTWISGRLERKLHRTNRELFQKNIKLENTLNELTKSEASRSATAIIYFIAVILFVLEEFFVEPVISVFGDGVSFGILIKIVIVLLLKVSEGFLEKKLTRKKMSPKNLELVQ